MSDINQRDAIKAWKKKFFDIALFIYFIAYFFHYNASEVDARIRLIGTVLLLISGILINLDNYKKISTATLWYLGFILMAAFSSLWAIDSHQVTSILITLIRVLIVGHFISVRVTNERDVERVLSIYLIATVYMCIRIGLLMANYYSFSLIYVTRFGDNFGYNSNSTAIMCLICILICIHKLEIREKKLFFIPLIVFFLIIMISTASKKGLFGLCFGIFLMLYYKNQNKRLQNIIYAIVIVSGIYIACMTIPELYNQIGARIESMVSTLTGASNASYSTESRIFLIKSAISAWKSKPLLGIGLNNFSVFQSTKENWYTHCNYVEILSEIGLIGFAIYYWYPFRLVRAKYYEYNGLGRMLKVIIIILLIFDFAMVSYQELFSLIFFWLYESVSRKKRQIVLGSKSKT